jgi:hypothetical protein
MNIDASVPSTTFDTTLVSSVTSLSVGLLTNSSSSSRGEAPAAMSAATFYKRHCIYLPAMAGWFVCSAALSAYNKVGGSYSHIDL